MSWVCSDNDPLLAMNQEPGANRERSMRTREEIKRANTYWESWANNKNLGNTASVQTTLLLEVLLDIRDLLAPKED